MSQKQFSRSVIRNGNSIAVTLPKGWANKEGVEEGDELFVSVEDGEIAFLTE